MRIKYAQTPREIENVRRLFREYETFLDVDLCFQSFEEELAGLPGKYAPPGGALLIGLNKKRAIGCVGVRRLSDGVCEMTRLFVRPEARGTGAGLQLAKEIIAVARALGYARMRLDTLDRLTDAMRLYETLGFQRIQPYYANPLPGVVYWELKLNKVEPANPIAPWNP